MSARLIIAVTLFLTATVVPFSPTGTMAADHPGHSFSPVKEERPLGRETPWLFLRPLAWAAMVAQGSISGTTDWKRSIDSFTHCA
jgi:hypothetical protein